MSRFGQLYFALDGRVSRRDYWMYLILPMTIVSGALVLTFGSYADGSPIDLMYFAVFFWPCIAMSVKRWHDIDFSGWWVLICFVPYIGWVIALFCNGFGRGTIGENHYGPDPTCELRDAGSAAL